MIKYFCCKMCGRCYELKGKELTTAAEKKMRDLEKSWLNQDEIYLCCREGHDRLRIKSKL